MKPYKKDFVFPMKKEHNGLKRSPQAWYSKLDESLMSLDLSEYECVVCSNSLEKQRL